MSGRSVTDYHMKQEVYDLVIGGAQNFDARLLAKISVLPGAGATVTMSRVDSLTASAHSSSTITVSGLTSTDVDWPFYRVSTAGGTCKVALV